MTPLPEPKLSRAATVVSTIIGLLGVPVLNVLAGWVEKKWGMVPILVCGGILLPAVFALGCRIDRREHGPGYSFRAALRQEMAEATPVRRFWLGLAWAAFFALPVGCLAAACYLVLR